MIIDYKELYKGNIKDLLVDLLHLLFYDRLAINQAVDIIKTYSNYNDIDISIVSIATDKIHINYDNKFLIVEY